ncbi:hypothetical protein HDV00_001071 [Rhizophlyctis rosea]|nr:hypothetical protein HDV00_001071 [Rhizophlyctis rosea]
MGALHEGHLSLARLARQNNDKVVASIFVNPAQFAPHEDLSKYPRTVEKDIEMLGSAGVDAVFLPSVEEMYPAGIVLDVKDQQGTFVEVKGKSHQMEGSIRPHFFRGVATVVTKLFNITQPTRAYFGQKDAQQCAVIRSMVRDLWVPIEVVVGATVRESDGLAMSSRNVYLSQEERKTAPVLYKALSAGVTAYEKGMRDREELIRIAEEMIKKETRVSLEYLSLANPFSLVEEKVVGKEGAIFSGAIKVGKTRIIDNVLLGMEAHGRLLEPIVAGQLSHNGNGRTGGVPTKHTSSTTPVPLNGQTLKFIKMRLEILLCTIAGLAGTVSAAANYQTLREAASHIKKNGKGFMIGTIIYPDCYNDTLCMSEINKHFNVLVAENECKFPNTQPGVAGFTFAGCDKALSTAQNNKAYFRGHNLAWKDVDYAPYLANLTTTELREVMIDHIITTVNRYKGKIYCWDVVNEAIADNSTADNVILKSDWIWDKLGNGWLDLAFHTARKVDPKAKLFYNDYRNEGGNLVMNKSLAVLNWVKGALKRGVPVHGVGFQAHVTMSNSTNTKPPTYDELRWMMKQYEKLGIEVHVTELDIRCTDSFGKNLPANVTCDYNFQAEIAKNITSACVDAPNCQALLTWGFTDKHSWLTDFATNPNALGLDANYKPKPMYKAMLDVLNAAANGRKHKRRL